MFYFMFYCLALHKKQVGTFKEFDTNDGIHNFFNISFNRQGVPRNISKKTSDKIDSSKNTDRNRILF